MNCQNYKIKEHPILIWIIATGLILCSTLEKCSAECPPPSSFPNGDISSKWNGYVLHFYCHEGYYLQGMPTITCRNGRWNHPLPTCQPEDSSNPESRVLVSKPNSQRYSLLRTLSDTNYQEKYDLPTSRRSSTAVSDLMSKTKRPLFSWDPTSTVDKAPGTPNLANDDWKKNEQAIQTQPHLVSQSINNQANVSQIPRNSLRRKKIKKYPAKKQQKTLDMQQGQIKISNLNEKNGADGSQTMLNGAKNIEIQEMKRDGSDEGCSEGGSKCRFEAMNYSSIELGQLDMSCMLNDSTFLPAPRIRHGVIDVYRRRHNPETPFNSYLEAFYICRKDYVFQNSIAHSVYCLSGKWVGQLPHCVSKSSITTNKTTSNDNTQTDTSLSEIDDDDPEMGTKPSCKVNKGGCQQVCEQQGDENSSSKCMCYRGYKLNDDQKTCSDVNECADNNGGCQYQCWNIPGSFVCYCPEGHSLSSDKKTCIDKNECLLNNGHGPCQDGCLNVEGGYQCHCNNIQGTQLAADNHTCEDIDECFNDNFGCAHTCLNTIGTAFCACDEGYTLGEDWKSCEDVNECEFPEIVNSCSERCTNTIGSYRCEASAQSIPQQSFQSTEVTNKTECQVGFKWNEEEKRCLDTNECEIDNFGCSHFCINVPGSASCSCPAGSQLLEDWKTCEDIDECASGHLKCAYQCVNTNGSAHCVCPPNYQLLADGTCEDINECFVNNGGCSQMCINTEGSHYCQCGNPHVLSADGRSCHVSLCMAPAEPLRGRVECDRELEEHRFYPFKTNCRIICHDNTELQGNERISCMESGEWNSQEYSCNEQKLCPILIDPENGYVTPKSCITHLKEEGELCYFQCHEGFVLKGSSKRICGPTLQWDPQEPAECIQMIEETVELQCPNSMTLDLPKNRKRIFVKLPHPSSNIDMRQLQIFPSWLNTYQGEFPSGITLVTVKAVHPVTGQSKSCSFQVNVRDNFPPIVYNCPQPITNVVIDDDSDAAVINWEEPKFVDNVGIVSVWKSREQGTRLPPGIHHVRYVARDAAGNTGHCGFSFQIIKVPKLSQNNEVVPIQDNHQIAPQNLYYQPITQSSDCKELQHRHSELLHVFRMAIGRGCVKNAKNFLSAIMNGTVPPTANLRVRTNKVPPSTLYKKMQGIVY